MSFYLYFMCDGSEKGWFAKTAEEAHKIIDVLTGKLDTSTSLAWMMDNTEWASQATTLVNMCVTGA